MKISFLDKLGALGVFVTALSCPVCWPLFASVGSALGLGILLPYESVMMNYVFPAFVVLALIGGILSYLTHKQVLPAAVGVMSALLILYGFYGGWYVNLMYAGIFGLLISAGLSFIANRKQELICRTAE